MSTIEWVRDLLKDCPALADAAGIVVDELTGEINFFSVDPLPGGRVVQEELDGTKTREFPFAISACQCSADEASRLETNGAFEALADWMEAVTDADALPPMDEGRYAEGVEATSWGYLFQREDDPSTAIYQISCMLTYTTEGKE